MADERDRSHMKASADAFEGVEVDCTKQTGADWYRLALAATYGGKVIHGHNATPSCEMLNKQTESYALRYSTARIRFYPQERNIAAIGPDITERPYTYRDFKGVRSTSGSFFAFDQGQWEPSNRRRAREASLLAAGIASHTGSKLEACKIVTKIAGDIVDERAVDIANIPVSHLRRDLVTISKGTYRVFSCGTIQRAIVWDDSQLLSAKMPEVAAIDWGRITALARFIAEANIQVDPKFRSYAMDRGVPYSLIQGSWAYVAYGDFVMSAADFERVPSIDPSKYGVPSLAKSYDFSAESMMKQCFLNLNRMAYDEDSPDAVRILTILEECKMKVRGSVPRRSRWTDTEVLAGPSKHTVDAYEASRLSASSATTFITMGQAVKVAISALPSALRLGQIIVTNDKLCQEDYGLIDKLTKLVLVNATWKMATEKLAVALGNLETAKIRMARLKRSTFMFSGALAEKFTITAAMAKTARPKMIAWAKAALIKPAPGEPKFTIMSEHRAMIGAGAMKVAVENAAHNLTEYRKAWVVRYEDWAEMFQANSAPEAHTWMLKYRAAALAFRYITPAMIVALTERFINTKEWRKSYLVRYAKTVGVRVPKHITSMITSAYELAITLDKIAPMTPTFVEIEDFVHNRLAMFAGDFGITGEQLLTTEEATVSRLNKDLKMKKRKVVVDKVVVHASDCDLSKLTLLTSRLHKQEHEMVAATYREVLGTYDMEATALSHAKANGYGSFDEAFATLGGGARYDMTSEYTAKALAMLTVDEGEKDDGMIVI